MDPSGLPRLLKLVTSTKLFQLGLNLTIVSKPEYQSWVKAVAHTKLQRNLNAKTLNLETIYRSLDPGHCSLRPNPSIGLLKLPVFKENFSGGEGRSVCVSITEGFRMGKYHHI